MSKPFFDFITSNLNKVCKLVIVWQFYENNNSHTLSYSYDSSHH